MRTVSLGRWESLVSLAAAVRKYPDNLWRKADAGLCTASVLHLIQAASQPRWSLTINMSLHTTGNVTDNPPQTGVEAISRVIQFLSG